jgi:hypothetical protein
MTTDQCTPIPKLSAHRKILNFAGHWDGFTLIFKDGSSQEVAGISEIAGHGVYSHPDVSIFAYFPEGFRPTSNTAKLLALSGPFQVLLLGRCVFSSSGVPGLIFFWGGAWVVGWEANTSMRSAGRMDKSLQQSKVLCNET